jgi:two-component system invasion response regulator UvrY
MAPIDILIVDPHPVTRAGIRQFLSVDPSLRIIGEASHAEKMQASDLVATIAVLGGCANTCHDELKAMKRAAPSLPVIVFSCIEMRCSSIHVGRRSRSGPAELLAENRLEKPSILLRRAACFSARIS